MIANTTAVRMDQNVGSSQRAFSACVGGSCTQWKMCPLPMIVTSNMRNATGRNATLASDNRMMARDQRAVTMRCTAASITPADAITVKKSQFTCHACQARSFPVAAPMMKTTRPRTASTSAASLSREFTGRVMSPVSSSRVGKCRSW